MPGVRRSTMIRHLSLISYEEALGRLVRRLSGLRLPIEYVAVSEGLGRISASTVRSSSSIPHQPISAMDGYGIWSASTKGATTNNPAVFVVEAPRSFGSRVRWSVTRGKAIQLFTGSPIPRGVDAVVRIENEDADRN